LAISVVFGALIFAAAYAANERFTRFRFVQQSISGDRSGGDIASKSAVRPVGFSELDPDDLVVRFADTRVGHVLFESWQSQQCRRLLFDNRTGVFYEAKDIFCGQRLDQEVEVANVARLSGVRQAFRR
jgi:hypothetical protein